MIPLVVPPYGSLVKWFRNRIAKMRTAFIGSLALFSILVAFTISAAAGPIYQWKDAKGLWHFTDFLPAPEMTVTKIFEETANTNARSLGPEPKTDFNPVRNQTEKTPSVTERATRTSQLSPPTTDSRWLFILPPINPTTTTDAKQFSGWIPDRLFKNARVRDP